MRALPLTESLYYSTLNVVMHLKYALEKCSISTQDYHVCMIVEFHYIDGRHILAFTMVNFDCLFGGVSIEINCLRMLEVSRVCCLKLGHTP